MRKFYKIRNDAMFKSIFCKEENWCLLEALIKEVIEEDVKVISLKVPELTKEKAYIKGKTLDVLVKTKDKEINLNNDDDFVKFLDDETEDRLFVNTFIDIGRKEGKEQHNIEIVKKMLQENIDIELISKITDLSIEEIKKINDEL